MKKPLGVLLLHGFTGLPETVNGLIPHLEAAGLPYRMPTMRGHFSHPKDMEGVTYPDWIMDASKAMDDLLNEVDKVVIVGLSMGGTVALELAMRRPQDLAGVVTVAAAIRFKDPLTALTPLLAKIFRYWMMPPAPKDCAYGEAKNYRYFPTKCFSSFADLCRHAEANVSKVTCPILILHSTVDQTIHPKSAQIIHDGVSSKEKDLKWFHRTGHEMMLDWEKDQVFADIMGFIKARTAVGTDKVEA